MAVTPTDGAQQGRLTVMHVIEATSAGVGRYVAGLLDADIALGNRCVLVYSPLRLDEAFSEFVTRAEAAGVEAHAVAMPSTVRIREVLPAIRAVRSLIRRHRPDAVNLHSSLAGGIGRLAVAGLSGRPRVMYTPNALAANRNRAYLVLEHVLRRWTDLYVAASDSEARDFEARGLAPASGVPVVGFRLSDELLEGPTRVGAAFRNRLGISSGAVLVAGCGRMSDQKDPVAFVRIVAGAARRTDHPLHAIWVGDGPSREAVEEVARDLGVRLTVTGWVRDATVYLREADVFVLPSRYESFGLVTAEAMACGLPVVATDVDGTRDLVNHGLTGWLVALDDLAGASARLAELVAAPEQAATMGQCGRDVVVGRMSAAALEQAWERALHTAMSGPALIDSPG